MKIISLVAENVKRLVAVQITPDGNMVEITGANGQGKTSVLDCIWWALSGLANIQGKPIRDGAETATIKLDMGEIVVTRKFKGDDSGGFTSSLKVEQNGQPVAKSPQALLDGLLEAIAFDPLAFSRMDAKAQFNALSKFVPGVDFAAIDADNKKDYDERTILNRQAKEEQAAANALVVADGEPIDEAALVQKLADASKTNSDITLRQTNRKNIGERVANNNKMMGQWREDIAILTGKLNDMEKETAAQVAKLENAPPLPALVDVAKLQKEVEDARQHNATLGRADEKKSRSARAKDLAKKADDLTKKISDREHSKKLAIAAAKLPVAGIDFGNGVVLLNGVPFNQGSDAEQLKASIAIAMAGNPKLRVIRVRDGSLLDEKSMKVLEQMANQNDYQVWIERVDSSGTVGFVLEDGHIKGAHTVKLPPNVTIDTEKIPGHPYARKVAPPQKPQPPTDEDVI